MNSSPVFPSIVQELISTEALDNYCRANAKADEAGDRLKGLSVSDLFEEEVADAKSAACCLSGLWLLHNFLHESHEISQDIKTAEGSYWHGIMHRMEGDFWNSKYWYRQVGTHPVFSDVADRLGVDRFDPGSFVDQCESDSASPDVHRMACAEWQALFEYCYKKAIG